MCGQGGPRYSSRVPGRRAQRSQYHLALAVPACYSWLHPTNGGHMPCCGPQRQPGLPLRRLQCVPGVCSPQLWHLHLSMSSFDTLIHARMCTRILHDSEHLCMQVNVGGDVLTIDVNSDAGGAVNSAAECCTACKNRSGCNAWTFCPQVGGCGKGCPDYVATYAPQLVLLTKFLALLCLQAILALWPQGPNKLRFVSP